MEIVNFGRSANQARFATSASSREFLAELSFFHERRRTAFTGRPMLNGRPIDLHKLYLTVCSMGGCRKVTEKNWWQKVCRQSSFLTTVVDFGEQLTPAACTNAAFACKLTYARWLEAFERVHLFGQPEEPPGGVSSVGYQDDFEPTRSRRFGAGGSLNVGVVSDVCGSAACGFQHLEDAAARRDGGLSGDTRCGNEYDRLALSLLSGLPNEVDLAFNALVLLVSTASEDDAKHAHGELDVRKAPLLVDLVLAHVGFYSPDADSLFPLHSAWQFAERRNFFRFWWLATSPSFSRAGRRFLFPRCFAHDAEDAEQRDIVQNTSESAAEDEQSSVFSEAEHALRSSAEACRVYQAALVLHAASSDVQRADMLLSRDALLRFLLVCCTCSHLAPLHRLAQQTLSNLCSSPRAMHAFLKEPNRPNAAPEAKRRALLLLVRALLDSADRHDALAGLELLAAVAHGVQHRPPASSDTAVQKHDSFAERAAAFVRLGVSHLDLLSSCHKLLLVADAALVVGALDTLLALASMKLRAFADHLAAHSPQLITLLVAFLSLDARALGRSAMRGVRVLHESVAVKQHVKRERPRASAQPLAVVAPQPTSAPSRVAQPREAAPSTPLLQHGRAAALQWLFLRCEMNEPPPCSKPSRSSSCADVTGDADLYADYLRFVSTSRAATCSTCGASASVCTCANSTLQALSAQDLKLIIRQVYPQIREAPAGGFVGLKLKSYLHTSAKVRPVAVATACNNVTVNGLAQKPVVTTGSSFNAASEQPLLKQARLTEPQVHESDDEEDDDNLSQELPLKRKRGRPRKSHMSVCKRPVKENQSECNRQKVSSDVPQTSDWLSNVSTLSTNHCDDDCNRRNTALRAEPPSVFAPPACDSVSSAAAIDDSTPCSVTREVIIERMKSKLERQRNERECATAPREPQVNDVTTVATVANGNDNNETSVDNVTTEWQHAVLNGFSSTYNSTESHHDQLQSAPVVLQYACKWRSSTKCHCSFNTLRELLAHAFSAHCNAHGACCWPDCKESSLQRSAYSLFMHLQDRHCREADFAAPAAGAGLGTPTRPAVLYPANAALQAVRKLAPRPPYRELVDAPEGVLTRHIRLTAALVLCILCDTSPLARDAVRKHLATLVQLAFTDRDASASVARILSRLTKHEHDFAMSTVPSTC